MRYFRLQQDHRIQNAAVMLLDNIRNYQQAARGNILALPGMSVAFVQSSSENVYPDVLDSQLFMIKEKLKDVFDLFELNLQYRDICLLDNPFDVSEFYFIPHFEEKNCISLKEWVQNRVILLNPEAVEGKSICKVADVGETMVIVTLDVAESIYRRRLNGVSLTAVNTCY